MHNEVLQVISLDKPSLLLSGQIIEQSPCVLEVPLIEDLLNKFIVELVIETSHLTDYVGNTEIIVLIEEIGVNLLELLGISKQGLACQFFVDHGIGRVSFYHVFQQISLKVENHRISAANLENNLPS